MKRAVQLIIVGLTCLTLLPTSAATLRVDGFTYRDLRAAYASAKDGDAIEVPSGMFSECVGEFHPPKQVRFVPVDGGTAIINGAPCDLPNDSFSNPIFLTGTNANGDGETFRASREADCEGGIIEFGVDGSLWWSWTAPSNGLAQVTSSIFGTDEGRVAGIFVGNSVCDLTTITAARVDPEERDTPVDVLFFDAVAGTSYSIAFGSQFNGRSIGFELKLTPHPNNDERANAIRLTGNWVKAVGSSLAATRSQSDPNPFGTNAAGKTVWWTWTAPPSAGPGRPVVISTAGSRFDTLLAVYQQTPSGLTPVGSNDDHTTRECDGLGPSRSLTSQVTFPPIEGATYFLMVDGFRERKDSSDPDPRLLMQYAGDIQLTLDYSTLNITSICHRSISRCDAPAKNSLLSGSLRLTHYGDSPTRALRVSFRVANGYSMNANFVPQDNSQTPLNAYVLPPGSLAPRGSITVDYFDVKYPCPDQDLSESGGSDGAKGWAVFAMLEEQFGDAWVPVDSTLITYGPWPHVPPFGGPNGGVIRSDPTRPAPNFLTDIQITGPTVLCENRTGAIVGQAVFDLGVSNAQPDWSWTGPINLSTNGLRTNALASVRPLTADTTATISASLAFAGSIIPSTANLSLRLLNNCSEFHAVTSGGNSIRFDYVDLPGKRMAIDFATDLSPPLAWFPLQTNAIPASGRLNLSTPIPTNAPQRFYRARELP